jgi:protein O-mannosyl-transferase
MRGGLIASLALLLLLGLSYAEVGNNGFVNFDDNEYISANEVVQKGWSAEGFRWAFVGSHVANWHPLTWLAHMTDVQLFGLNAGAHHWSNVAMHAVASLLLLGLAWRCGASVFWSFWIAAIFALHPLHVESVTWISERKDTLSAALAFLSLHFYLSWGRQQRRRDRALCLLSLVLGLMAKPMLVTLPAVFTLMDLWPLRRPVALRTIFVEKLMYWGAVVASVVATVWAQSQGRALHTTASLDFAPRLSNALVQWVAYITNLIVPRDMAVFYPHPGLVPGLDGPSKAHVVGAALLLIGISVGTVWLWRRHELRWPFVGWTFYLGTLVPVIGLVQVGPQAMADRYSYLPSVGVLLVVAGAAIALEARGRIQRIAVTTLALALVLACIPVTRAQVRVWESSETLWHHALNVTQENWMAHNNLGTALSHKDRKGLAMQHYSAALRIKPDYAIAHFNLGKNLIDAGEIQRGIEEYRAAISYDSQNSAAMNNLGNELARQGRYSDAVPWFDAALRFAPDLIEARVNLGWSLIFAQRSAEARPHFLWLLERRPNDARAHHGLAQIYLFDSDPRSVDVARRAIELDGGRDPRMLETLARALGANGQQEEAMQTMRRAADLFHERGMESDAERLGEMLARQPTPSVGVQDQ